ncbi:GNAT domain-containing protein [Podospora fimiseda]|uniref:GNAT domain-containing protein n=1 Tax=Podospora fimiseda TaxID=252190 RepID=A0AAN7H5P0_9PEZI|nr:GNAT domain-containing protein [Podospora fimiseda]
MKLNEHTAVSTAHALLVPYDHRHVLTYHAWMEDPAIQEATASEPLTLEEEYENQESWRASHDKLTFIICQPIPKLSTSTPSIEAGEYDSPSQMIGDVNLFLYPDENDDEIPLNNPKFCIGEVDIMLASSQHRGKGLGKEVIKGFLKYVWEHREQIMREYAEDKDIVPPPGLKMIMAKVSEKNENSLSLFERKLGFEREGEVNYFGEVKLVLRDLGGFVARESVDGYKEVKYLRE